MIKIEVYATPVCSFEKISKEGYMEIPEGTTLLEVLKIIKLPFLHRKFSVITVNSDKVKGSYVMKDKDVLSIFMPVTGG